MAKVSIMVPSYNHEAYIKAAIDSIFNQTFQDFEVIISDDHSTDATVEKIREYDDNRIHLHVFEKNVGATRNHEYCWQHCTSEYIALLNSDDVWLPEHLERSAQYLDTHPECGAVFSWCATIDEDGAVLDPSLPVFEQPNRSRAEWLRYFFTHGNCICHPSMVIRSEIYQKIGFYSRTLRQLPDFDEWIRLVKCAEIYIIPEVLVQHRRCNSTMTNTSSPVVTNSIRDVVESQFILSTFFDDLDDELFLEAFYPLFKNKLAQTHEELLCEKYFLLKDGAYYMKGVSSIPAFQYFQRINRLPGVTGIFESTYKYELKDYFEFGSQLDILGLKNAIAENPDPGLDNNVEMVVVMTGNPNSMKNRLKLLAWAVFGKDTKLYKWFKRLFKKEA